jgi:hypothetical protein
VRRRDLLGVLAGGSALLLGGCAGPFRERYRFKLTVEVETPQGPKSGFSVIEVWATYNMPGSTERLWGAKGEAVAVDLPDGQVLFALLKTSALHGDMAGLSMATLDPQFRNDVVESAERIGRREGIRSPAKVAPKDYPVLVRFKDKADPKSVELVDPLALDLTFGKGVQLKQITAQVTNEPMTEGIERKLSWLPMYYDKLLSGERYERISPDLADHLGAGHFSTELSK